MMNNAYSKLKEVTIRKHEPKNINQAGQDIDIAIVNLQKNLGPFSEMLASAINGNAARVEIEKLVKEQLQLQHENIMYNATLDFTEAKLVRFNSHMKSNQTLQQDLLESSTALVHNLVDIKNGAVAESYRQAKRHTDDLKELYEEGAMTANELEEEVHDVKNMRSVLLEDIKEKLRLIGEQHAQLILETVRLYITDHSDA